MRMKFCKAGSECCGHDAYQSYDEEISLALAQVLQAVVIATRTAAIAAALCSLKMELS